LNGFFELPLLEQQLYSVDEHVHLLQVDVLTEI
jgi:hypothetical protein